MNEPKLDEELQVAEELARRAGEAILELYGTAVRVEAKGGRRSDPVTEADRRANALIVKGLREAFPGDGVVAEESPDRSDALHGGRVWYVDPLDGTKEFLARNGEFAVMIGLAVEGEARLGVVFQPARGKLYTGVVGRGAWLEHEGKRRALRAECAPDPSRPRLVVSRSHRSELVGRFAERASVGEEVRSGSVGLKVGLIAEGRVDLYVHPSSRTHAWDACGPDAVLRAAGGFFGGLDGRPLRYGGEDLRTRRGLFACTFDLLDPMRPLVRALGEEAGLLAASERGA